MQSSSAGAQASDQALAAQAAQQTQYGKQAHDLLFGSGADGKGGSLSQFLDPNSLNVSGPTGAYKLQYNNAVSNIAQQTKNATGEVQRSLASRGFGNAPAGFAADQLRQTQQGQVAQQGAAFTDLAGRSYSDALQNFWNANNLASGAGAAATNASISADSAAANNYANLYGTSSTPKPSVLGQVIGGGLQAGGAVGAAAACPCEGSLLLGFDGIEKPVQAWDKGQELMGIDGKPCVLLSAPRRILRDSVEIKSLTGRHRCSIDHTFVIPQGGYIFAHSAKAQNVRYEDGITTIMDSDEIGNQPVYVLELGGSHSYRADGFWALS